MPCKQCKQKICLKSGKPCREIENLLEREQSRIGYSSRHLRRKEIPYSQQGIDHATIEAIENIYGHRKITSEDEENEG